MSIRVLFFGVLRDIVGQREVCLDMPKGMTVAELLMAQEEAFPRLRAVSKSIVPAVNQNFAAWDHPVTDGDEVAFLPPVSGGSGFLRQHIDERGNFFALTREPLDPLALRRHLLQPEDGAVVIFEGVTRNNTKGRATRYLEYECYEPMAIKVMSQLGAEIAQARGIGKIGMIHRLGRLEISEASVVVVACSPHRQAAFDAALDGINRLKKLVPVWKKEYFADGEVWVEGEWDDSVVKAR